MALAAWPVCHLVFRRPWTDGLLDALPLATMYALGDYAYFHLHGGTDGKYPDLPDPKGQVILPTSSLPP